MTGTIFPLALAVAFSAAAGWLLAVHTKARCRLATLRPGGRLERHRSEEARQGNGTALGAGWSRLQEASRASRERRRRRVGVMELCFALAGELRAGRTPVEALERAVGAVGADSGAELAGVVIASRTGGDVAAELRSAGMLEGAEGLRRLAACWQVGSGSGAGFAPAVERLAGALRAEEEHREEVATSLAGTHSTARLLAALPLIGLLMSTSMGMRPFAFLLGTPYGLACLALGAVLDVLGVLWTRRLARAAAEAR